MMRPRRFPFPVCYAADLPRFLARTQCRSFASAVGLQAPRAASSTPLSPTIFFISNRLFDRSTCLDRLVPTSKLRASSTSTAPPVIDATQTPQSPSELPPHRRRQAQRKIDSAADPDSSSVLPDNASSILTTAAAAHPSNSLRRTLATLLSLSKPRLTMLVTLTAMASYALYPVPELLSASTTEIPSLSPLTLLFLTVGTFLCSSSANALNMLYETKTDAIMSRTRNRPLVRRLLSTRSAVLFAVLSGAAGVAALYFGVNPTVSFLGLSNIVLYAGIYTPLKAFSVTNTWVGGLVGGIPPLMGWAAAAGEVATRDGSWKELLFASDGSSIGGWLLAGLLFAWQFPHFMAVSWSIREDYKAAGLRMLACTNPARNARVALRYSVVFAPLCFALCAAGVTDWSFAATSLPINVWIVREAVRFWRHEGHAGSARGLFWASVWHLPGVMILALLHKKGMWARAWRSVFGVPDEDEDGVWEDDEEVDMVGMAHKAETAAR
ncbi:UbiA prenyltransferase family-domain-containing protein [Stachybotrys elegans]|uniref:Protoheme IX farnesyltransferase, mitochondrial n=1 Tax=Stachybotrys elegans TaxID=80388 RepID=A0A8K0SH40_9HYPO|nr:UbiA prenyltransferase family-domain-containing protein [Stachybotrys elegans]